MRSFQSYEKLYLWAGEDFSTASTALMIIMMSYIYINNNNKEKQL
jgi:hypothetical protein